jgi:hypothetical protein
MLDELVSKWGGRKAGFIMKPKRIWGLRGAIVVAGLALGVGAVPLLHADDGDQNAPQGRAVRLSSVDGPVQVMQGGQLLTDQAVANTPLFEGTQVSTGNDGRAEVQFEDGSVARIPPQSQMTLSVLQPNGKTEILLGGGMGYIELQGANQDNPVQVRFGSDVVTASGFTVVRVKLDEGPPAVAVFSGNAHIEGPGGAVDLHGGESIALNGANPGDSTVAESIEPDSWDAWNSDRDQALTASESAPGDPNIPQSQSNNPAWGDLNQNGTWYDVPGQGQVWSPYAASNPNWDPFAEGYWAWSPNYGYMWVSVYSWGYLPYQFGIWNWYDGFGWGWAPGNFNPWWGGGGGGWGYTVVAALPTWYRLPIRPGPLKPHDPHWNVRARPGNEQGLIAVHRTIPIQGMPAQGALPSRDRTMPVTIGGVPAAPVRSEPVRTIYNHQPAPGQQAPGQYGRTVITAPPERPVYGRSPQAAPERPNWPAARPAETGRPASPPPAMRSSPPPARPSYGGGGGGHSSPPPPSHSSPPPSGGHPK